MALEQFADHRQAGVVECVVMERHQQRLLRETQAVIGQHQHVPVVLMFEVIVDAFFLTQPLQEGQIALIVLNAKKGRGG